MCWMLIVVRSVVYEYLIALLDTNVLSPYWLSHMWQQVVVAISSRLDKYSVTRSLRFQLKIQIFLLLFTDSIEIFVSRTFRIGFKIYLKSFLTMHHNFLNSCEKEWNQKWHKSLKAKPDCERDNSWMLCNNM